MIKQVIEVSSENLKLSLSRGFLVLTDVQTKQTKQVPLDMILCVVLSAENCLISKHIINALVENNASIVFCNDRYLPNAIVLPVAGHWLAAPRIRTQINVGEVLRKNLWKKIVQYKIDCQRQLLASVNPTSCYIERLKMLSQTVKSGDIQNNEGQAAHLYFAGLFGSQFVRDRKAADANMVLNYAYTVLRAMIARSVCGNGLLPYIGLKHCQQANTIPLVDDLIEPFRPIADKIVCDVLHEYKDIVDLNAEVKRKLAQLTNLEVHTNKGKMPLAEAIDSFVASLVKSYEMQKVLLDVPEIRFS